MRGVQAGRLATGFDVEGLVRGVDAVRDDEWQYILHEEEWSSWTGVSLLSHDGKVSTLGEGPSYVETDLVRRTDAFRGLLDFFRCPLRRVRVLKLKAGGGRIHEHSDELPPGGPTLARLQLPLVGAEATEFTSEGIRVPMACGELWYVDVTRLHSVVNRGTVDRTSVVIDCEVNGWLEQLIANSAHQLAASRGQAHVG